MKKILILMILFIVSLMVFIQPSYALVSPEHEISDGLTWTSGAVQGYHYVQSNRIRIDFAEVEMEFYSTLSSWSQAFLAANGPYNSVLEIYSNQISGTPLKTYMIAYEAPDAPEMLYLFDNTQGDYNVSLRSYKDKYMQITLLLNPAAEPTSPSLITNAAFYLNNYKQEYSFTINVYYDVLQNQTISSLPLTSGNPYQEGLTGTVWDWAYNQSTNTFHAKVNYYMEYNLSIPNVGFSDGSFLENVVSIDYYSVDGQKYFQFNFDENDNVLLTGSGQFAKKWNGFAVWNLSTNEFIMYNRALALTYIEVTEDRKVNGYLYLPSIPIDDLVAVSGSFNYRYGYKNVWGTQRYDPWKKTVFFLEKDKISYGSQSIFEGAMPQWSYDLLAGSLAAFATGAIVSMVPGLQVIGLPLLAGGVAGIIGTNVGAIDHAITGKTSEIQTLTPPTLLRNKLNDHYTKAVGSLMVLPTNAKVHKLYFGMYTKTGTNVVEPDADSLVYTEITWATKGQVYTLNEKLIDSKAVLDEDYKNSLPPEGSGSWFDDIFKNAPKWVIALAIILVVLVVAPALDKGTSSLSNILSNRRKVLIVIVIVIIFLFVTGIIKV